MFIYSVRASTVKFVLCISLCLAVLLMLLSVGAADTVYASASGMEINYGGIKTNEDRVEFIEGFGLKVKEAPVAEQTFTMPENFDRVISGYNQVQKSQGLDLEKYKNKRVTHYAYEVTNYDYDGTVYVNLIVYRNKIIAADISSAANGGFLCSLVGFDRAKIK